jgi:hypothetical protein
LGSRVSSRAPRLPRASAIPAARTTTACRADNATQTANYSTLRDKTRNYGPSPFDVRHVLQTYGTYDLPFGRDRRFNMGNAVVNAILGDWVIGGILTAQSGSPFRLSSGRQTLNQEDAGVLLAPGVSVKDLQKLIGNFQGTGVNQYFIDPKAIAPDGRASSAYLLPPTTLENWDRSSICVRSTRGTSTRR